MVVGGVVGTKFARDQLARRHAGILRDIHAVGSHVGDEPLLVELLGHRHRAMRRKAADAGSRLLQGGSGERRIGVTRLGRILDRDHAQGRAVQVVHERRGVLLSLDVRLLAIEAGELRGEGRRLVAALHRLDAQHPVGDGVERLDLALALHEEPQRHGLHAPGRERIAVAEALPQQRRHLEAHQTVQNAPRLLRIDARMVDLARMGHRVLHGTTSDFVVGDAADGLALRDILKHFAQMPGDGLPFAVRIGREQNFVRRLRRLAQLVHHLFLVRAHLVGRRKRPAILHSLHRHDTDRQPLLGQITHMPDRRLDDILSTEIFLDRLRLRRRFHYQQLLHFILSRFPSCDK